MIIEFHLTGENRKALVKAISEILEISAEYQYMPTCAYKIGECYTVTKEGDLEISDSADGKEIEMLISELASRGYEIPSANKLDRSDACGLLHRTYPEQSLPNLQE